MPDCAEYDELAGEFSMADANGDGQIDYEEYAASQGDEPMQGVARTTPGTTAKKRARLVEDAFFIAYDYNHVSGVVFDDEGSNRTAVAKVPNGVAIAVTDGIRTRASSPPSKISMRSSVQQTPMVTSDRLRGVFQLFSRRLTQFEADSLARNAAEGCYVDGVAAVNRAQEHKELVKQLVLGGLRLAG